MDVRDPIEKECALVLCRGNTKQCLVQRARVAAGAHAPVVQVSGAMELFALVAEVRLVRAQTHSALAVGFGLYPDLGERWHVPVLNGFAKVLG